jgi:tartrate dehydrogenase/decarboxylase/D-malate dehydrogenase
MRNIHLATVPADGIGPEVIEASQRVLKALAEVDGGIKFEFREFDWGAQRYLRDKEMMPADGIRQLTSGGFDGILLGPVGSPKVPDHVTLWGLLLPIRQQLQQYVNLRPLRLLPGVDGPLKGRTPADIDMICFRENSEGEYSGVGGRLHQGTDHEVAVQSIVFTRSVTERLMRFAFEWVGSHGRKGVTNVTKSNSMQHNMVFWDDIFKEVGADYPSVKQDHQLVDSMAVRMVAQPQTIDTFVASNLFGDILTDLGAALAGSLGLAPSANINPERKFPSLFQAIHGSAFDIAGKNVANPIASIWSAQLMLDFVGEKELSTRLMNAIETVVREREVRTPDLGGKNTTQEMTAAICAELQK